MNNVIYKKKKIISLFFFKKIENLYFFYFYCSILYFIFYDICLFIKNKNSSDWYFNSLAAIKISAVVNFKKFFMSVGIITNLLKLNKCLKKSTKILYFFLIFFLKKIKKKYNIFQLIKNFYFIKPSFVLLRFFYYFFKKNIYMQPNIVVLTIKKNYSKLFLKKKKSIKRRLAKKNQHLFNLQLNLF